jgi:hypothetical protein
MPTSKHNLSSLKKKHKNGKVLTTDEIDFLFSQAEAVENKEMSEIMVLQEIRGVLGDQGQMMQSELVECIRTLAKQAEESSKSE